MCSVYSLDRSHFDLAVSEIQEIRRLVMVKLRVTAWLESGRLPEIGDRFVTPRLEGPKNSRTVTIITRATTPKTVVFQTPTPKTVVKIYAQKPCFSIFILIYNGWRLRV